MSAQAWYAISLVGYFVAAIGLVATIVIYIKLDILDVIGDLTGRTVAREIKNMQDNRGAKNTKKSPGMSRYNKTGTGSKNARSAKSAKKYTSGKGNTATSGGGTAPAAAVRRKAKNGTAEMGLDKAVPDKRVLHSKTDKLSRETEELYEDFDPRVEYSRPASEKASSGGTAVLKPETEVLKPGTGMLTEAEPDASTKPIRRGTEVLQERGTMLLQEGTALLEEEAVEPVKFSITRSYLVVHSEESIL